MKNLLLLSNSTNPGEAYFDWPKPVVKSFLGTEKHHILFIPYAGFSIGYDAYEAKVKEAIEPLGYQVTSIHQFKNPIDALNQATAIAVGGGNTFYLFHELHRLNLIEPIKKLVNNGLPYFGWSAGANTACPTLKTSNDMPIVEPQSFNGLNLIPFQINPHYTNATLPNNGGETRNQRIQEFLSANQKIKVVGLPESCYLILKNQKLNFEGTKPLLVFEYNKPVIELIPGTDVTFLM